MNSQKSNGVLEVVLAALAFVFSLVVTIRIWAFAAVQQEMWPLPALYLLEVVALPATCFASALRGTASRARVASIAAGALLAFSILGAWTVGLFYGPLVILLTASALAARGRTLDRVPVLLAFLLGGALVQASLMILVIRSS